jgi:hypothetical protein
MSEVIYVDFKNKKKMCSTIKYNWIDALSGDQYVYNSEMQDNEPHVEVVLFINTGKGTTRIPQYFSVKSINELIDAIK